MLIATVHAHTVRSGLLAAVLLLPGAATAAQTGVVMRDVYDAIAYLLPLSLVDDAAAPWDQELVENKLDVLIAATETLASHGAENDAEFRLLARSFDSLVDETAASFREQWPDYAYYSLMRLTDHCVACHARQPAESQDTFAEKLIARMDTRSIPLETRALLYVATRQFDRAMSLLEEQLSDPALDPIEADYNGTMIRYLRIGISVADSIDHVREFLQRYREREDLPYYLRHRIDHWVAALGRHAGSLGVTPNLKRARQLFDAATERMDAPGNRLTAVEDFMAGRLLRAYLRDNPDLDGATRSDIYYRLALISLRSAEPDPGVPEMEVLLAAAIEAAPQGPLAKRAYALLEEYGYVHDEHLARQDQTRKVIDMAALRAKIEADEP